MDRHKVGTEVLVKAAQIVARNGYATSQSLKLDIPCSRGTADRIVACLKATGNYVKRGYGIVPKDSPTFEHSPTFPHKDSPTPKESTTYKDSPTSKHSPTKIPPHSPTNILSSQLLRNTEAVQNGPRSGGVVSNGAGADGEGFLLGMEESKASTSGSQKEIEEPAPFPLALSGAADEEQQPWGPDENEQAHLEYQEWLALKHKTKEITGLGGAGASHRSVCDGGIDIAAYQQDLDKLIAILSTERDAWKLNNRQLGVARSKGNITRLELCRGKRNHNELLRVIVDLTVDRESGELRYYNLQAAGETLDMCWSGWRQKMAMDPDKIQHYRNMAAQQLREAKAAAWEARRHAAQDRQDEIPATKAAAVQEPAEEDVPTAQPEPIGVHSDGPAALNIEPDIEPDDSDPEWDRQIEEHRKGQADALAHTSVYLTPDDFTKAAAKAEEDTASRLAQPTPECVAGLDKLIQDMADAAALEAAAPVEEPASPEPSPEPVEPSFGEKMARLNQEVARLLAARAEKLASPAINQNDNRSNDQWPE